MQSQIDKLELENDTEKEIVDKLLNAKKTFEDRMKIANEATEKMVNLKEELEKEVERLKHNEEHGETPRIEEEHAKLKRKLEICENVIDELKVKACASTKINKELQENLKMSGLFDEANKEDIEKELFDKTYENSQLLNRIDQLRIQVIDQKEEIDGMKNELVRKDSAITNSSCGSLADEIESANQKLEKDNLKGDSEGMKVKLKMFDKNKRKRFDQLNKLSKLSASNIEAMSKLKSTLEVLKQQNENLKQRKTTKCKYGWKCSRGRMCTFNHIYLYKKVNMKSFADTSPLKKEPQAEKFLCEECDFVLGTKKKLRKHQQNVHKLKCKICEILFASIIKLEVHIKKEHQENEPEQITVDHKETETERCEVEIAPNHQKPEEEIRELEIVHTIRKSIQQEYVETTENVKEEEVKEDSIDYRDWNEFECELCKKDFTNIAALDNHMDNRHSEEINCGLCNKDFHCIKNMNDHMDMNHKGLGKMNDPNVLRAGECWVR